MKFFSTIFFKETDLKVVLAINKANGGCSVSLCVMATEAMDGYIINRNGDIFNLRTEGEKVLFWYVAGNIAKTIYVSAFPW